MRWPGSAICVKVSLLGWWVIRSLPFFAIKGPVILYCLNYWLENCLLPSIGPGYTIVMDNAAFHKSEKTKILIEKARCNLLFLPPYSPDLNPIEKFWANLKAKIRKCIRRFPSLADAIDNAFCVDHL